MYDVLGGSFEAAKKPGAAQEKAGPSEEATTKEAATEEVKRLELHEEFPELLRLGSGLVPCGKKQCLTPRLDPDA